MNAATAQMKTLKIYGCSDDLIEMEGAISDEYGVIWGKPTFFRFTNGALVKADYSTGEWQITLEEPGDCIPMVRIQAGSHADDTAPDYSDILVLQANEWVLDAKGTEPPTKADPATARAREIMRYLQGRDALSDNDDDFLREIEEEIAARIANLSTKEGVTA